MLLSLHVSKLLPRLTVLLDIQFLEKLEMIPNWLKRICITTLPIVLFVAVAMIPLGCKPVEDDAAAVTDTGVAEPCDGTCEDPCEDPCEDGEEVKKEEDCGGCEDGKNGECDNDKEALPDPLTMDEDFAVLSFDIEGMTSEDAVKQITDALSKIDGIAGTNVSLEKHIAWVRLDEGVELDPATIIAAITDLGYSVKMPDVAALEEHIKDVAGDKVEEAKEALPDIKEALPDVDLPKLPGKGG